MYVIGNDELDKCRPLRKDGTVTCRTCGKRHKVKYGYEILRDGTKRSSRLMGFYTCKKKVYLATLRGKVLP